MERKDIGLVDGCSYVVIITPSNYGVASNNLVFPYFVLNIHVVIVSEE